VKGGEGKGLRGGEGKRERDGKERVGEGGGGGST